MNCLAQVAPPEQGRVSGVGRGELASIYRRSEQSGLPAEDARAAFESQFSEKDLAQVRAAVQADFDQISRDALHQSPGGQKNSSVGLARKHRQII